MKIISMSRRGEQFSLDLDGPEREVDNGETQIARGLDSVASELVVVKALSLRQPYANWVAEGRKTIETRTWSTRYRGDILICASTTGQGEPKGVALCMVELLSIRPMTKDDEEAACVELYKKALAWELSNRRVLEAPFPVKGRLGLFDIGVDPENLRFAA